MPERGAIPGLKRLPKPDGYFTWYWAASQISRWVKDFRPRTARLWHGRGEPSAAEMLAIHHGARQLSIDLKEWLVERNRSRRKTIKMRSVRGFIYFARVGERVKIGFSKTVRRRLSELQTFTPDPIDLLLIMPGSIVIEHSLHRQFAEYRISGEWFYYSAAIAAFAAREQRQNQRSESLLESQGADF